MFAQSQSSAQCGGKAGDAVRRKKKIPRGLSYRDIAVIGFENVRNQKRKVKKKTKRKGRRKGGEIGEGNATSSEPATPGSHGLFHHYSIDRECMATNFWDPTQRPGHPLSSRIRVRRTPEQVTPSTPIPWPPPGPPLALSTALPLTRRATSGARRPGARCGGSKEKGGES